MCVCVCVCVCRRVVCCVVLLFLLCVCMCDQFLFLQAARQHAAELWRVEGPRGNEAGDAARNCRREGAAGCAYRQGQAAKFNFYGVYTATRSFCAAAQVAAIKGESETIAQRYRGCSLSRVRVNGVIIHLRPGGRTGRVTL